MSSHCLAFTVSPEIAFSVPTFLLAAVPRSDRQRPSLEIRGNMTYRRQVERPVNENSGDADVIDVGGRWRWDGARIPRAGIAAAALAAGRLVLGYTGGHVQATAHRAPGTAAAVISAGDTAIVDTGSRCADQQGRDLQLGMEVVNQSAKTVALRQITPVLPLGGLRPVASEPGSCGLLAGPGAGPAQSLAPGATGWLTVTLAVLVKCPQPLPVEFKVSYLQAGRVVTASFAGFNDLGQVRYGHCSYWK